MLSPPPEMKTLSVLIKISRSALFHMKTRDCIKCFLNDCPDLVEYFMKIIRNNQKLEVVLTIATYKKKPVINATSKNTINGKYVSVVTYNIYVEPITITQQLPLSKSRKGNIFGTVFPPTSLRL